MSTPAKSKDAKAEEEAHFENIKEIKEKYAAEFASVRSLLTSPCDDDVTVYRFLRGHKMNIQVAAEHLNSTIAWRKENQLDQLRQKANKITQRQYPNADRVLAVHPHNIIHGHDKFGQPLSIERLGYANPYLMVRTIKFEEMLAYHFYHMEGKADIVAKLCEETGTIVRTAKIMDLAGLGRHHLDRRGLVYFKKLIDMSQSNYPEMLGKLYVVNTPWIFSLGWKIVKPWLNEKTLSKIHILQGNNFLEKLKEDIDIKNIPQFLGGECTCGGTGCVPLVDPDASMETQQIAARGKFETKLNIDQEMFDKFRANAAASANAASSSSEGSSPSAAAPAATMIGINVAYEFRTKKHDIGFEIRSSSQGTDKVLKASERYQSNMEVISGQFLITEPTVLTFEWSNSFSYFTSKTLLYRLDTDPSFEDQEDIEIDRQVDEADQVVQQHQKEEQQQQ